MAFRDILSPPALYHHIRNVMTGGLPLKRWAELSGLFDPRERVADLGCGPADLLRNVHPDRCPQFYLGIDISEKYLDAARRRASVAGVESEFLAMDLERNPRDAAVRMQLLDLLTKHRITRVILLGVIHHIDDESALTTLNLVHEAPTVSRMTTQDVLWIPGNSINNRFCRMDRGEFIREEAGYDALIARSNWPRYRKEWSTPGLSAIKYIHYLLSK